MNREIKFKVWHEGYKVMAKDIYGMQHSHCYFKAEKVELIDFSSKKIKLLQFTGLKDSKGNEIYEGDILQCRNKIVKVFWNKNSACFDCDFISFTEEQSNIRTVLCNSNKWFLFKVVGNIYENPELLK